MIGRLGTSELLIVLVIVLFIFGPSRLPSLARSLGEAVRGLRSVRRDVDETVDDVRRSVER